MNDKPQFPSKTRVVPVSESEHGLPEPVGERHTPLSKRGPARGPEPAHVALLCPLGPPASILRGPASSVGFGSQLPSDPPILSPSLRLVPAIAKAICTIVVRSICQRAETNAPPLLLSRTSESRSPSSS